MNQSLESFSINTKISTINQELTRKELSLSDLIALSTSLEVLIIKNPKLKNYLEAKISQIDKRILKVKSNFKDSKATLAESLLILIKDQ